MPVRYRLFTLTLGPRFRLLKHGALDGRTKAGKYVRTVERQLTEQLEAQLAGTAPTIGQRLLIHKAAVLSLSAAALEQALGREEPSSPAAYATVTNALSRTLARLQAAKQKPSTRDPPNPPDPYAADMSKGLADLMAER